MFLPPLTGPLGSSRCVELQFFQPNATGTTTIIPLVNIKPGVWQMQLQAANAVDTLAFGISWAATMHSKPPESSWWTIAHIVLVGVAGVAVLLVVGIVIAALVHYVLKRRAAYEQV